MNRLQIEQFARSAISIIIQDIMEVDVIIPNLIFDYSINQCISSGYYMHQNLAGNIITLNMPAIEELRVDDDIKTIIVYGFVHEIVHYCQDISSRYKTDPMFYNQYEDSADRTTIEYFLNFQIEFEEKLNFKFNEIFIEGIKRQLGNQSYLIDYDHSTYVAKTITGALCNKLNYNFDYLYNLIRYKSPGNIKIIFPDKREYNIILPYSTSDELNLLINLIYLTDIKFINTGDDNRFITDTSLIIKLY